MSTEEVIEILETEKTYMLMHGGDRQAVALSIAIEAIEKEPCEDAISRGRLKECFHRNVVLAEAFDEIIDMQPPVQPKAKSGKWEHGYSFPDGEYCKCSECKEIIKCIYPMHYCPNCGAKMEVEG